MKLPGLVTSNKLHLHQRPTAFRNLLVEARYLLVLLVVAAAIPATTAPAQARYYVDSSASGLNDGTSWTDAVDNPQLALAMADSGDVIWVAEGAYSPDEMTGNPYLYFLLPNGVSMLGGFTGIETDESQRDWQAHETILTGESGDPNLSGSNSAAIVVILGADSSTVLDGFTVTEGAVRQEIPEEYLGGIVTVDGSPVLRNLIVSKHDSRWEFGGGAGMYNYGGNPTLENVVFRNNWGLGGFVNVDGSPLLRHVQFIDNTAWNYGGGGMVSKGDSRPILKDVLFLRNVTGNHDTSGGGFNSDEQSVPSLDNVQFIDNIASWQADCAGMKITRGSLKDVSFIGNHGYGAGGLCASPDVEMVNSVFIGNSSEYGVAAFIGIDTLVNAVVAYNSGYHTVFGNPDLVVNSTIAYNSISQTDYSALVCADYRNTIIWETEIDTTCVSSFGNSIVQGGLPAGSVDLGGNTPDDPWFMDPDGADNVEGTADDNFRLLSGSPAIDGGLTAFLPPDSFDLDGDGDTSEPIPVDLDGMDRIQGAAVDIGAYESSDNLPIELTRFGAVVDGHDVILSWAIVGATSGGAFSVEQRMIAPDSISWHTAASETGYRTRLTDLAPARYAFRLKMIESDGSFTFSPAIEAVVEIIELFDVAVFPNPASTRVVVRLAVRDRQRVIVDLFDVQGRRSASLLATSLLDTTFDRSERRDIVVNTGGLAAGVYFVRVRGDRFETTRKLIIAR